MKALHLPNAAAVFLAACQPAAEGLPAAGPRPERPAADLKTCAADELRYLSGSPVGSFDFGALMRPVRILPPGSLFTQEFAPQRLNVDLDGAGTIIRLWCG